MFNDSISIKNKQISQLAIGTATFAQLHYFGHRSKLYELEFNNNPESIFKILENAYNMGIKAIQLIPEDYIIDAVKLMENAGMQMDVWGTVRKTNIESDINNLSKLNASMMFLDEWITDKYNLNNIKNLLKMINDTNSLSGLMTSLPKQTTTKILDSNIIDLFDAYMIPINNLGYLMDYPIFLEDEREDLSNNMKKLNKIIIANKVLAAGILSPEEAFNFIKRFDYIDLLTVAVASQKELNETFNTLLNL